MNRLLVSTYVYLKKIEVKKNKRIKELLIQKEDKEEYQSLSEFTDLIKNIDRSFNYEELLELFEFVISPSDKVINGAIYTPCDIREFITTQCFLSYSKDISKAKIVDISCGCGGFLIDAVNLLKLHTNKSYKKIFEENIFGIDIQKYSIERTEILLLLLALEHGDDEEVFKFNLYDGDSLEFEWNKENKAINKNNGFDIILGNPPYVCSRNMDDKTKSLMSKWDTCSTGHPDLYIPFFEIGYKLLNKNGILGYITVNSFIKSVNGRAIRKFFQDNNVDLKIIDFEDEQIFNSRMTYTSICFISKNQTTSIKYKALRKKDLVNSFDYEEHSHLEIDNKNGWYIKNREIVKKIESIGTPFGKLFNTKSGIATLKNSVYIFKPVKVTAKYYFIDENIKIEKEICKDIINSNFLVKQIILITL
jgi:methylase of polypeptide subunit release factors